MEPSREETPVPAAGQAAIRKQTVVTGRTPPRRAGAAWKSSPGPLQTEWQTQAASGEGPAGTFACVRADAAHRLAASIHCPLAAEEPARGGLSGASPSRPLRRPPPLSETETPRLTQSPFHGAPQRSGEPRSASSPLEKLRRRASAGSAKAASGDSFSRTLQSVRSSWRSRTKQLRNGARTVTADNILSTRVQRKARGSSVAARAPGQARPAGEGAPAPASYHSPAEDARRRRCFLSPSRRGRGNPPGRGAGRVLSERNRRPTWLILPVAYACLKD